MIDAAGLKGLIREVQDFPKPGISFKDLTTLLKDPDGLRGAVKAMVTPFRGEGIDLVIGIESRGFILGAPMAIDLGCGFVPVRKPGKLPAATIIQQYLLEYGRNAVEIHQDGIAAGQRVLLVDDLLATGGTMKAACLLCERLGANIIGLSFLMELLLLKGRDQLGDYRIASVITF